MNEFLAEMYGTRESIGAPQGSADDIEKLAEAQILSEELAAEGYDASKLPTETLMKVAYQLWGADSALVKAAQEEEDQEEEEGKGEEEDMEEEGKEGACKQGSFEEKVAEADFLGRVMAHSFVNEQSAMEKAAYRGPGAIARMLGRTAEEGAKATTKTRAGRGIVPSESATKLWEKGQEAARQALRYEGPSQAGRGFSGAQNIGMTKAEKARAALKSFPGKAKETGGKVKEHLVRNKGKYIAGGVGTAALGGGAYALGKKKAASALDVLAEQRAMEMLKEAGYGEYESEEYRLKEAIDQRALELLDAAGYLGD